MLKQLQEGLQLLDGHPGECRVAREHSWRCGGLQEFMECLLAEGFDEQLLLVVLVEVHLV